MVFSLVLISVALCEVLCGSLCNKKRTNTELHREAQRNTKKKTDYLKIFLRYSFDFIPNLKRLSFVGKF